MLKICEKIRPNLLTISYVRLLRAVIMEIIQNVVNKIPFACLQIFVDLLIFKESNVIGVLIQLGFKGVTTTKETIAGDPVYDNLENIYQR